jgi:DNA replication protein DnaC
MTTTTDQLHNKYVKRAIEVLGESDVSVYTPNTWSGFFEGLWTMTTEAKKIKQEAFDKENGHILLFGHHNNARRCAYCTLELMETPNKIRFVHYLIQTTGQAQYHGYVVPKKIAIKFALECRRFERTQNTNEYKCPIIEEDLLKNILDNSISFLKKLKQNKHLNLKVTRGLIFTGEPGNGKTMLCKYLKEQAENSNLSVAEYNSASIDDSYRKNTLSTLFTGSNIIFFDDIDIDYFTRKHKVACAILGAMDGMDEKERSVRIFSTNENIEDMDPAFRRPGRIDMIFEFPLPSVELRTKFIKTWNKEIHDIIPLKEIVDFTEGFSFAEMEEVRNQLLLNYVINDKMLLDDVVMFSRGGQKSKGKKKVGF